MGEEKIYDKIYLKQLSFIWFFISWLRDQMAITFYSLLVRRKGKSFLYCLFGFIFAGFPWLRSNIFWSLRSHFSLQGASIFRPSVLESVAMKRMEARHKFGIWIGELLSWFYQILPVHIFFNNQRFPHLTIIRFMNELSKTFQS